MRCSSLRRGLLCVLVLVCLAGSGYSYSVLTHEAIIDSLWTDSIEKLLLKKFPHLTAEQLTEAHAYAYGGCVIQDMGYYPFAARAFSDLTHYVRSGDFVMAMLRDAGDPNEYAFALGSLAHYTADNTGHPLAVNRAVPLLYPKLQRKFGDIVTYADNAGSHVKTEFGFDVLQVARGRYAPEEYREFIGFEVSKPLLERAFAEVYGVKLTDVFGALDLSIGTYRRSVSSFIPKLTKAAWAAKGDKIVQEQNGVTRDKFLYNISRADYEKNWGREYRKPGFGTRLLAFLLRIMPKIGPFKAGGYPTLTPETEELFQKSFNATVANYRAVLNDESEGRLQLANENFDVGQPSKPGSYEPADAAYASLVHRLAEHEFKGVSAQLRRNILAFYDGAASLIVPKRESGERRRLTAELEKLRAVTDAGEGRD